MSVAYEEIIEGVALHRSPPPPRHEAICDRLHAQVASSLAGNAAARLLAPRSLVQVSAGSLLRPDLALVTAATGKLWLVAEIVSSVDHRWDTVTKKQLYEDQKIPRLWMIDPRYDNVEIYHGSQYGLALKQILANREMLVESALPNFRIAMMDLFQPKSEA